MAITATSIRIKLLDKGVPGSIGNRAPASIMWLSGMPLVGSRMGKLTRPEAKFLAG